MRLLEVVSMTASRNALLSADRPRSHLRFLGLSLRSLPWIRHLEAANATVEEGQHNRLHELGYLVSVFSSYSI
jgi:hypothetical protein